MAADGREWDVDFLIDCRPNSSQFIEESAIEYEYSWGKTRVMHPFACMRTRVYNVIQISGKYDNPHGVRQLEASISVLRRFVWMLLDEKRQGAARKLLQQIYKYSLTSIPCRLYREKGIDTFDAVALHPQLSPQFEAECYPRWKAHVAAKRKASG